jgi:hypothetical protein
MCGAETSRPVLGGTIAILKSLGESTLPDLSLLFHQTEASTTTATFQSASIPESTTDAELSSCQIVILYVPLSLPFNDSMVLTKQQPRWRSQSFKSNDIDLTCVSAVSVYNRVVLLYPGSSIWELEVKGSLEEELDW